MRPIPLSDNLADKSHQGDGRTEACAIYGENALRQLELKEEMGENYATIFMRALAGKDADKIRRVLAIQQETYDRLTELKELMGEKHAIGFYQKALIIWTLYPPAYWVLMHLMTGDLSEVTNSYTEMGQHDARTKQAVQQEWERILNTIKPHYPELAIAIQQIRNMTANLEPSEDEA